MKTVKVVAAVICNSLHEKRQYLPRREVMENLRDSGSSLAEKLSPVKPHKRLLQEKYKKSSTQESASVT